MRMKKSLTKRQERSVLCAYAQKGCLQTYGFQPDKKQIAIYESHISGRDPQYVLFGVGGYKYAYDGITLERRN